MIKITEVQHLPIQEKKALTYGELKCGDTFRWVKRAACWINSILIKTENGHVYLPEAKVFPSTSVDLLWEIILIDADLKWVVKKLEDV